MSPISFGEPGPGSLLTCRDILRMDEIIWSLDFDHEGRAGTGLEKAMNMAKERVKSKGTKSETESSLRGQTGRSEQAASRPPPLLTAP